MSSLGNKSVLKALYRSGIMGYRAGAITQEGTAKGSFVILLPVLATKFILGDTDYDYRFDEQHSSWKATVGLRPISPVGVELEYIDFGNPSSANSITGLGGQALLVCI